MKPAASIVIPSRNREDFLTRAVRSCFVSAGSEEIEVIVSVDGGEAGYAMNTARIDPRIVLLGSQSQQGRGRARNVGLMAARGRYVKFLDDDDWLEPGALEAEIAYADATSSEIVASGYRVSGEGVSEEIHWPPPLANGIDSLLRGEAVPTAAALYRRELLAEVRWVEGPCKLDDWHFFIFAALRARAIATRRSVAYTWFSHPGQVVQRSSQIDHIRDFYWILDELERVLVAMGELTNERRLRLAQYRYKELRPLCKLDRAGFEREVRRIRDLDPAFAPRDEERRATMRWLALLLGFRRATLVWTAAKSLAGRP